MVQLLIAERIGFSKDFLISKVLDLILKVLAELRKRGTSLENEALLLSVLEQIKWTIFVIKDRETQQNFSP